MDDTLLARLPFWEQLTQEQRELLRAGSYLRHYDPGRFIYNGGEDCLGMVLVLRGRLRAFLLSEEGREITLYRLSPGEPCVLTAACVMSQISFETHMAAEELTELLIVKAGLVAQLAGENVHVRCFLYELAAERFSAVLWALQQILFKGFDRRLAERLVAEHDRTGQSCLRVTHEQLARDTNSAREVVTRMLKRFAADGLVELGRGAIRLKDVPRLREMK